MSDLVTPWKWIKDLLKSLEMEWPDGRPLYSYRVNSAQFSSLTQALRTNPRQDNAWQAAFVFFAAEWWRREYSGGAWSWRPIFEDVGLRQDSISIAHRNEIITHGLAFWKRKVLLTNQTEYLASIVLEGGLPLKRLQREHVGSDKLLPLLRSSTAQLMRKKQLGLCGKDVVRGYSYRLPQTFQRDEVYIVLGQIVEACVQLRAQYALEDKADPISWLNENVEGWETIFPLSMEDDSARGLLEELVREAARLDETAGASFEVRRSLYLSINKEYHLSAELVLPQHVLPKETLESFSRRSINESHMTLMLIAEGVERPVANLGLINSEYRIRRLGSSINDALAQKEIRLRLENTRTKELLGDSTPPGGSELDDSLPWIFIDEEPGKATFLGQGSVSTKTATCLVALSDQDDPVLSEGGCLEYSGTLAHSGRKIYTLMGNLEIIQDGFKIRIKTGQENVHAYDYILEGKRLNWKSNPRQVFIGFPKVRAYSASGLVKEIPQHDIKWREVGNRADWNSLASSKPAGIVDISAYEEETVLFRRRIAVLKDEASLSFRPGNTPQTGSIIFNGFGFEKIGLVSNDNKIQNKTITEGSSITLSLMTADIHPPSQIKIFSSWPHQLSDLELDLPYPASGARFFDGEMPLGRHSVVFAEKLHGIHARIFNQTGGPMNISVNAKLEDGGKTSFWKDLTPADDYAEVRLIHYEDAIKQIFASTDDLDRKVTFRILCNGEDKVRVDIQKYEANIEFDKSNETLKLLSLSQKPLTIDDLDKTVVKAMPIWLPEREPHICEPTSVSHEAVWNFQSKQLYAGPWLIFPSTDSAITFRPRLINIKGEIVEKNSCQMSQCALSGPGQREDILDSLLSEMEDDLGHSGWLFLENSILKFGHLPLSSLDLFRRMISNPNVMASAALVMDTPDFDFLRFSRDLPFMWECVSYTSWNKALTLLMNRYINLDPELKRFLIEQKISDLRSLMPDSGNSLLNDIILKKTRNYNPGQDKMILSQLNISIQTILREIQNDSWPVLPNGVLNDAIKKLPSTFTPLIQLLHDYCVDVNTAFRKTVLLTPILLGISWLTNETYLPPLTSQEWFMNLQTIKSFHPDWFANGIHWAIAYGITKHNTGGIS